METKALISFAVTAKLICIFVYAYAKIWFSQDAAQFKHSKILTMRFYNHVTPSNSIGNSEDPDQNARLGAVSSGSALFHQMCRKIYDHYMNSA